MPTRGVSRIHEAIINKPEGVAGEGLLIIAECIHDTPRVGMVWLTCTMATVSTSRVHVSAFIRYWMLTSCTMRPTSMLQACLV